MYSVTDNKIQLTRGDTLILQVAITRDGEPYTPEDGDSVRFALKHPTMDRNGGNYIDQEPLILKTIPTDTMVLTLEPADTKPLEFGRYDYDIEITFADGRVDTFIRSTLKLTPEVH